MSENQLLTFHRLLEDEITDYAGSGDGGGAHFREIALTEIISEDLAVSGVLESPQVCHYEAGKGSGSFKVDAYGVPEEDTRLDLILTIYEGPSDSPSMLNASDVDVAFNKLERFLNRAMDGLHAALEPCFDQYLMAQRIHEIQTKIDRVNFHLVTNLCLSQRREKDRKAAVRGLLATYEIWDLERLRRLRESGTTYEALTLDLTAQPGGGLPCTQLKSAIAGFQTCITIFPGTLLSELYNEHGAGLLELNVRSYLQARGKVNKGILETLRKNPEDFMAYNNGITVVAEEITLGKLKDGSTGILALKSMQIVNGGQTTASIHRAEHDFSVDLSNVFVQAKITIIEPSRFQEVVPLISRYSNTQNKVSEADLSANQPFHIGIERVSKREWSPNQQSKWFYERARGAYQTAKMREGTTPAKRKEFERRFPPQQRFTKEDLAKFENSWRGLPHYVSRGAQKNFVHFMSSFPKYADGWEPEIGDYRNYIAKGILFRETQKLVRSHQGITAYRINVTAYTAAAIAEKTARRVDLDSIWKLQGLTIGLSDTIYDWAYVIFKHLPDIARRDGKHVEELFKSLNCWEHILSLDLKIPHKLETELLTSGSSGMPLTQDYVRREKLSFDDQNNIARCRELTEDQWLRIAAWGLESGEFEEWQRGIARTLAGYAAEGWKRAPGSKQAKFGSQLIETAKKKGDLSGNGSN